MGFGSTVLKAGTALRGARRLVLNDVAERLRVLGSVPRTSGGAFAVRPPVQSGARRWEGHRSVGQLQRQAEDMHELRAMFWAHRHRAHAVADLLNRGIP